MEAANLASSGPSATILALVAADGTAAADHAAALSRPGAALRDVADAIHTLCILHGSLPGIVDHVKDGCTDPTARAWLDIAATAVTAERGALARLASAVGPQPSTPGQAASEGAVTGQRHALDMLARSDRAGCALGTALAFVLDWAAVRGVLDAGAARCGVAPLPPFGPLVAETRHFLAGLEPGFSTQRAMVFGAQQMLAQHRGLWHLLEARASARAAR
ncbi:DUF6975 family protein [Sphingomonas corticis]|uniref:Urease accessory protein UreF n=1 Tax=Sphingomonas corticis TaxID=2722791 RepID=A0ABX1CLW0_9SPHN|nr:hypothetical protein [Sphingomonas corticis]NJR77090.1 hypothetical protein [Sphingomonas corticis]